MARGRKKGSKLIEGKVTEAINEALPDNINLTKVGLGYNIQVNDEALEGFSSVTKESVEEARKQNSPIMSSK